jgi:mRNA interferase MazF
VLIGQLAPLSEATLRLRGHDVLGRDHANATAEHLVLGVVTIVPATSKVAKVYPFQTLLPAAATGLRVDSKAQAEQVRSVAV